MLVYISSIAILCNNMWNNLLTLDFLEFLWFIVGDLNYTSSSEDKQGGHPFYASFSITSMVLFFNILVSLRTNTHLV